MAESKMAEFHEIAKCQPIQVRFVSNLELKFSFQPILKSKSNMAESKMAEFLEISIYKPIQVQFVSNLELKFRLGL